MTTSRTRTEPGEDDSTSRPSDGHADAAGPPVERFGGPESAGPGRVGPGRVGPGRVGEECEARCVRGCRVRLRPLRPGDRVGLGEMFQRSSDRAVRQRFFTSSRDAVADYLDTVTSGSLRDHCSVVALVDECVVGLAEYQPIGSARAEIACFVDEDHHHSGVGELLVGHLARLARHHGVRTLEADVLSDNTVAARALRGCGLPEQRRHHPGTIHIRLDLTETPASPVSSGTERAGTE